MSQQRVREALQAAEGYLSGEELSRGIGITRAAVWKAVENLRRQGYDIEARTGKGYRLRQSPDLLRRETVEPYLTARRENWQVLETVDSTNSLCRRLALEGAPPGMQPEQQVLEALGEEELTGMILNLREPYCTPCRLVLLEQHTMAEAARLCGRPPKTVEAQVYRAKKMLAQQILQNDRIPCERRSVHGTV